uniref:WD repeat, sterile alpha motif and U-box domain containing 1 n=1 Tax=Salmo trutta TaxID=8032 RepID=A0A674DI01_SALTR
MVSLFCTLQDHRNDVNWCTFSPTLLPTCSADKTLRIYNTQDFSRSSCSTVVWSTDTGEIEAVLEHPGRNPVRVCAFSPDSSHLVLEASDVFLNDYLSTVNDTTMVACSFTPCGQMFVTGSTYGDLRLWDLDVNQLHAEKNTHELGVTCYCFGPKILSGGDDDDDIFLPLSLSLSIRPLWPVGCKMQLPHTLTGRSAPVLSFTYIFKMYLSVLPPMILCCRYVTACAFSPSTPLIATVYMVKILMCGHFLFSDLSGRKFLGHSRLLVSDWSEEGVAANVIDGAELVSLTKETLASELNVESVGLHSMVLRKVGELKAGCVCTGVPDEFFCPITRELMKDPVIAAGGTRKRFESWITTKNRSSPMTNLPLRTTLLTPNRTLKMAIGRWRTSQ